MVLCQNFHLERSIFPVGSFPRDNVAATEVAKTILESCVELAAVQSNHKKYHEVVRSWYLMI